MALKLIKESLPEPRQEAFNLWLRNEQLNVLRRVVTAKATELEVSALNHAEASENFDGELKAHLSDILQARRYLHALEVIDEILSTRSHQTITSAITELHAKAT